MTNRHTYWVSIGRNTGADVFGQEHWTRFKAEVHASILDSGGTIVTTVEGSSDWEGQPEETYLVLASIPAHQVGQVRAWLSGIAGTFDQDAIGFVGGPSDSTLIQP
jgi:hypothetical protein